MEAGALGPWVRLAGHDRLLQGAGNTSTYDFGQRRTKAGHRDTVGVDTTQPDTRTLVQGVNSLRGADPREGVRVDQRREHGSPFSSRCTKLALIQAGSLNFLQKEQSGCTVAPKVERSTGRGRRMAFCSRCHYEGYGKYSVSTSDPERHERLRALVREGTVLLRKYRLTSVRIQPACIQPRIKSPITLRVGSWAGS